MDIIMKALEMADKSIEMLSGSDSSIAEKSIELLIDALKLIKEIKHKQKKKEEKM